MFHADDIEELEELSEEASNDLPDLEKQLEHNLASLLLKMQSVLHIPESSVQEVVEQLCQIHKLSQPLVHNRVRAVLSKYPDLDETVLREVISAVSESNTMSFLAKDGPLGTAKRRAAYVRQQFPLVSPIEYIVEKGQKPLAYVPILSMLQKLLNNTDVLNRAMSEKVSVAQEYRSYVDGQYFNENSFLTRDEFTIALGLYIDDFEIANPLGTSKLKHKMCAVYWVIANIPAKYRSTLNSIQLALLCNTSTVKKCGYAKVLQPLIYDLKMLEQNGVYLEKLGKTVRGTVLFVAADNLGAHSLAGFLESFSVERFCRFCMAGSGDAQQQEVCSGFYQLRDKDSHDRQVQEVRNNPELSRTYGVKGACPLTENLDHFHVVTGYPPDIMHDVFEGVVPIELSLCLTDLIGKTYFTLDVLNHAIKNFNYTFADKTDRPQVIGKGFSTKGTIGGNAHENWCLIRLLPFLIGSYVPEGDNTWEVLMLLKDIIELVVAPQHTEETLQFLEYLLELPEKPTIKIIPRIELEPVTAHSDFFETNSQADTDILSVSSLDRSSQWPDAFPIPKFSVDVEYRLRQGNLQYLRDETNLKVPKEMKHDILEKLAETIYGFKAYPTKEEFDAVAEALVQTHPCLKEPASSSGWEGWKNSLKFKMGNYRNKMRKLGRLEVSINAGKRGRHTTTGDPPNKDIKKPRKGEINFLPENPEGMDDHNLEGVREVLANEMKKTKPNGSLVKKHMDMTFALRRKEVVNDKPDISQMILRWPALFTESQVYYEFNRVVGKNLRESFFDALDHHSPNLMDIFRKKKGLTTEPTDVRSLCLRGLPVILGDDPSAFFKTCSVSYQIVVHVASTK
ncbi:sterile alpha motif domain-containing 3-like protein [Labeo rohita]|uniref:Sterile alpha motif domain-containing 3-like protein n=1 Tax=Labeo rohita TaxID=84645 RepID=A0A498NIV6_LABRO|nr:sterile alpha motif domain-containing 3-like protein [Labeo rohita]